jgi:glycosyltransferase involved in cell wall biosynthesis
LNKILIIHYEFFTAYLNKNIGYFIDSAISKNYEIDFFTLNHKVEKGIKKNKFNIISIQSNTMECFNLYKYIILNAKEYKYVWIYPGYRYFIFLLFLFKLFNIKVILKTDSMQIPKSDNKFKQIYRYIRKKAVISLTHKIIVENDELLNYFEHNEKVIKYPIGLPNKNIEIISSLQKKIEKEKVILYIGRINHAKGLDRLINIFCDLIQNNYIDNDWKLKVIGKVAEKEYFDDIVFNINQEKFIKDRITIEKEKSGKNYYSEILNSSLVILPTRGEGLPNVLADTYFSKRLFLTTTGAKVDGIINDKDLFCENNDTVLFDSIKNVMNNIDKYYMNFDSLYDSGSFVIADDFFKEILDD